MPPLRRSPPTAAMDVAPGHEVPLSYCMHFPNLLCSPQKAASSQVRQTRVWPSSVAEGKSVMPLRAPLPMPGAAVSYAALLGITCVILTLLHCWLQKERERVR